jgi:hypothetical protein
MMIRSGKPRRPNWYGSRHNRTIDDLIGMPLHLYILTIRSSAPAENEETNWSLSKDLQGNNSIIFGRE